MKKRFYALLVSFVMLLLLAIPAAAVNDDDFYGLYGFEETELPDEITGSITDKDYVVDDAGLLTDSEEEQLEIELSAISLNQQFDVVVVTKYSLGNKTAEEYADDFYDYNCYGQGEEADGCLLLIGMEDRDWHISTSGFGIDALTDYGIQAISNEFLSDLSAGNYYEAFSTYAGCVDEFVTSAKGGNPVDYGGYDDGYDDYENYERGPRAFKPVYAVIGIIIGALSGLGVTSSLESKLKSVNHKAEANDYLVSDSFVLVDKQDNFIRSNVNKVPIPTQTTGPRGGGGGGSSIHVSSSGHSHGGGGGHF